MADDASTQALPGWRVAVLLMEEPWIQTFPIARFLPSEEDPLGEPVILGPDRRRLTKVQAKRWVILTPHDSDQVAVDVAKHEAPKVREAAERRRAQEAAFAAAEALAGRVDRRPWVAEYSPHYAEYMSAMHVLQFGCVEAPDGVLDVGLFEAVYKAWAEPCMYPHRFNRLYLYDTLHRRFPPVGRDRKGRIAGYKGLRLNVLPNDVPIRVRSLDDSVSDVELAAVFIERCVRVLSFELSPVSLESLTQACRGWCLWHGIDPRLMTMGAVEIAMRRYIKPEEAPGAMPRWPRITFASTGPDPYRSG